MSAPMDLIATFIPNEGEFHRVKLALDIAIDEVVKEPGCIRYELTEATEEKLVL
ncbi:MAG: putative quinol monooxygenase, partial [Arthrobacter sp.]